MLPRVSRKVASMRHRKLQFSFLAAAALSGSAALVACSADHAQTVADSESVGAVGLMLQAAPGFTLNTVTYTILGPASFSKSGSFDVSQSVKLGATLSSIPAGQGYSITLGATSADGKGNCAGSASFNVVAHQTTQVVVSFLCHEAPRAGSVIVNGTLNLCPGIDAVSASPAEVLVGSSIALVASAHDSDAGPAALSYHWSAPSGSFSDANVVNPSFTCLVPGSVALSVSISDGDPLASCTETGTITVRCTDNGSGAGGAGAGGASGAAAGGASGAAAGGASGAAAGGASGAAAGGASGAAAGGASGAAAGGASAGGAGGAGGQAVAHLDIYRVGDGASSLVNTGNPVFVDEYTTDGAFVRSIAMPLAVNGSNRRLVASGTATSEGLMTRSVDGHFVLLTGYDAPLPTASLSGTTGTAVPRIVGRIAADGTVDTSTQVLDGASGNNPRSVASTDGTQIWFAGAAGGVRFLTAGNTSPTTTQLSTTVTNLRQVGIFGSQLYVSDSSGTAVRLGAVGTGLPTTAGQTITNVSGFPVAGSPYAFHFADLDAGVAGVDVLYVASDDALGITKYSLVGGSWLANGTVGVTADAYRGLTATVTAGTVTLFATRKGGSAAAGGGELVSLIDASGYNGAFAGTPTVLATAAANTAFRGVALAPAP